MEDKIEIGEYVKTKDGKIGILNKYSTQKESGLYSENPFDCCIQIKDGETELQCRKDYIVKHSKQLIAIK